MGDALAADWTKVSFSSKQAYGAGDSGRLIATYLKEHQAHV
jgi:hypothetical protein